MNELEFLIDLSRKGIQFGLCFDTGFGRESFSIGPNEIMEFRENPDLFLAHKFDVTLQEYLSWKSEGFSVQCSAITKIGKRCRNVVEGGSSVMPKEWSEKTGQYCSVHGNG